MITEDQTAVIEFLSSIGDPPIERIDTHISVVFLSGTRALKLKRAVKFDYLDFSTADRRKAMCDEEVRLNRRTAPELYRGVVAVTRESSGRLALDRSGTAVDWIIEMARFDQEALLDRLAAAGRLDVALMPPLGAAIARFHAGAAPRRDHGGREGMQWVVDGNAAGFAEHGLAALDPSACDRVTTDASTEIAGVAMLLDERRQKGFVRQCHGDLHLRNIVLLDHEPTLFDAVEFNDEIACIDTLYDLAFLLMDLWRRDLPQHANAVWNSYLFDTGALAGLALMPLFLSCRAAIRAKTSATAASVQPEAVKAEEQRQLARDYLAMAERFLRPVPPLLVAIGGYSGSGKSTLARALAPSVGRPPGAVILRSDEIRKRLCGVAPSSRLGPDSYTPAMSARVYAALAERAEAVIRTGHGAVVDAVFARASDRLAIEQVAVRAGVPFVGLWLEAPETTLIERARQRRHDVSDADASVVRTQLSYGVGEVAWNRIDASPPIDAIEQTVVALLRGGHAVNHRLQHGPIKPPPRPEPPAPSPQPPPHPIPTPPVPEPQPPVPTAGRHLPEPPIEPTA